jgi:hypothetical protein
MNRTENAAVGRRTLWFPIPRNEECNRENGWCSSMATARAIEIN